MILNEEFKRSKENILNNFYPFEYLTDQNKFKMGNYKFLAKILIPTALTLGILGYYTINQTNNNKYNSHKSQLKNTNKILGENLNPKKLEKILYNV